MVLVLPRTGQSIRLAFWLPVAGRPVLAAGSLIRSFIRLWALSLMLSVLLVAAGERWPGSLPVNPTVVAALVLGLPLLQLLWLVRHWSLPGPDGSGTADGGESQQ
jgi:hypothetical protein